MKPSRRNKANEARAKAKRAESKPAVSRFERKFLAPEEIRERELALVNREWKGGAVSR